MWDTENVSHRKKFDSLIFPAAFVPQVHEEECPFMKKFDSRIPNAADLRQQSGRKGSLTLGFQCGTIRGSNQEGRGVLLSYFNAQWVPELRG